MSRHNIDLADYDWFCDNCNDYLNIQEGFTTKKGEWRCTTCGFLNDISADSIVNTAPEWVTDDEGIYSFKTYFDDDINDPE